MKYHVHIYSVSEKREIDVEAETEIEAKTQALNAQDSETKVVMDDCRRIAIAFES